MSNRLTIDELENAIRALDVKITQKAGADFTEYKLLQEALRLRRSSAEGEFEVWRHASDHVKAIEYCLAVAGRPMKKRDLLKQLEDVRYIQSTSEKWKINTVINHHSKDSKPGTRSKTGRFVIFHPERESDAFVGLRARDSVENIIDE